MAPRDRYSTDAYYHDEPFDEARYGRRRPRQSVRFSATEVRRIENRSVYSEEHKSELWYNRDDFSRFKNGCKRTAEWVHNRRCFDADYEPDIDDATLCTRGLERWSREGSRKYFDRRSHLINEIYVSKSTGISPKELAALAQSLTNGSKREAENRGLKDEEIAMICHDFGRLDQEYHQPVVRQTAKTSICRDQQYSEMDRFLIEDCSSWCMYTPSLGASLGAF